MNNYKKGNTVAEPLLKCQIPMQHIPKDFLWMHVNPGTKMRNVLRMAMDEVDNKKRRVVLWSGSGQAVGKVISCAEIMKRQHSEPFHQVNKICYRKIEEHWDPLVEGLEPMVVTKQQPTIHILLSKDLVDTSQPGYQSPVQTRTNNEKKEQIKQDCKPPRKRIDCETFESFGLRSARTKGSKKNQRGGLNLSSVRSYIKGSNSKKHKISGANHVKVVNTKAGLFSTD